MSDIHLVISEATGDHIKIAGVLADKFTKSLVGRKKEEVPPLEIELSKVAEHLETAVACAAMGGTLEGNRVMFKHPVTIKSAAQKAQEVVVEDYGLSEALSKLTAGSLTKEATNAFCDELVEAIEDAKVDAQGALNLSMPLKIEFRDEATKQAFMGLGRRKRLKKVAAAIKELGRHDLLDSMAQKLAFRKRAADEDDKKEKKDEGVNWGRVGRGAGGGAIGGAGAAALTELLAKLLIKAKMPGIGDQISMTPSLGSLALGGLTGAGIGGGSELFKGSSDKSAKCGPKHSKKKYARRKVKK